jgi:gluconate kinase
VCTYASDMVVQYKQNKELFSVTQIKITGGLTVKISDRLLRSYLEHVYWICGGPCGGKSTMTTMISSKWEMGFYSSDDHTFDYQKKANPQDHPAILRYFVDWEWYFLGKDNDRNQWLNTAVEESVEFIILDLLQMGNENPVIVDTDMAPDFLKSIADNNRIVFLFAEEELIQTEYFEREHVEGMESIFLTLSDPQLARSETLNSVIKSSNYYLQQAKQNDVQYFIRDALTTKEEVLSKIEKHFQLT